jgi:hypothetical protein
MRFRVQPHGSFKAGFDLLDGSGTAVGTFAGSAWREGGRIRAAGQEWEFRRAGGRRFVLAGPGGEHAAADRVSFWTDRWEVSAGGRTYELVKPGFWSRRYELRTGGRAVGVLTPKGVFDNKAEVELPDELPPAVALFTVVVVMRIWRRQGAAAGAAGASGAAAAGAA